MANALLACPFAPWDHEVFHDGLMPPGDSPACGEMLWVENLTLTVEMVHIEVEGTFSHPSTDTLYALFLCYKPCTAPSL